MDKSKVSKDSNELSDGIVSVRIAGQDCEGDLLCLKLACEQTESEHKLKVDDGIMKPTADFLRGLAERFKTELSTDTITPTQAYELWERVGEWMEGLKKNTNGTPN